MDLPTVPDGFRMLDLSEDLQEGDLVHDLLTGSWCPATPDTKRENRAAIRRLTGPRRDHLTTPDPPG